MKHGSENKEKFYIKGNKQKYGFQQTALSSQWSIKHQWRTLIEEFETLMDVLFPLNDNLIFKRRWKRSNLFLLVPLHFQDDFFNHCWATRRQKRFP